MKLLIIDGSNLLFQMFYGMPARITGRDGRAIQGTLGFTGALLRIIRMTSPTHVLAVFDGEGGCARTALDPLYKANRPDYSALPEEETPFSQLADVYAALDFLGVRRHATCGCEADDVIAAYAMQTDGEVVISSFDSDFFQLISPRVSVLRYRGEKTAIHTPQTVMERMGVAPAQYAEHKAMTGDTADNIPGAPHIGPKTAAALLHEYGSLEAIIAHAPDIKKPAVRASVMAHADRIRRNLQMIRLDGRTPLPIAAEDLTYRDQGLTTGDVLRGIGLK
ncbi:MAG: flap endonuclease [Clostridia bacterium]|nr:flap endonuclease [Clostridia bacterium]